MKPWLAPALDYVATWLDFQRRHHDQPGCVVAIAACGLVWAAWAVILGYVSSATAGP